jgi:predicted nucleotidyltransferase
MIDPSLVTDITEVAQSIETVHRVYLFGSRVKGGAREDSDLDVAIAMIENEPRWMLAAYIQDVATDPRWAELSEQYGVRVALSPIMDVAAAVAEHGQLIFDRDA